MINKELFDSPKDAEIAKLKMEIEAFKKYDAERKEYYAKSLQRLGELEAWYDEINDFRLKKDTKEELKKLVKQQKMQIAELSLKIQVRNIEDKRGIDELKEAVTCDNLKKHNKSLQKRVESQAKVISKLVYELNKLRKEHEN